MLSSTRKKSARGCLAALPSPCSRFRNGGNAGCSAGYTPRRVGAKDAPSPSADRVFSQSPMPSDGEGIKILDLSYDYFFFFILPLAVTSKEPQSQVPSPFPTCSTVIFSDLMVSVANSPPLAPPSTSSRITFSRFSL